MLIKSYLLNILGYMQDIGSVDWTGISEEVAVDLGEKQVDWNCQA